MQYFIIETEYDKAPSDLLILESDDRSKEIYEQSTENIKRKMEEDN